jgi:DNA polymerase-1
MIEYEHFLGRISVPGPDDDLTPLYRLKEGAAWWSADTETTGLKIFSKGYRVRLVQVGTRDEAWVLRPGWHDRAIADMTMDAWWHNMPFDALSLEQSEGLAAPETLATGHDSEILSRVLDPRGRDKGGVGHKLKDLSTELLGLPVKDAREVVLKEFKRLFGGRALAKDMWANIPIDNEVYVRYAGQDVFLEARLAEYLSERIAERKLQRFVDFEHALLPKIVQMQRIGTRFDAPWAKEKQAVFLERTQEAEQELRETWHVDQSATWVHTSKTNLITRFTQLGVKWVKRTDKGAISLDASVLDEIRRGGGDAGGLAEAVLKAKQSLHYANYLHSALELAGKDGRIHPSTRPMQAATARMSISDPPVQQWPTGQDGDLVRGCLIADDGDDLWSADYSQVEWRVGAAVSGDKKLREMILAGEDIHATFAEVLYGKNFTKEQRSFGKGGGFGWLYRGLPKGIHRDMLEKNPLMTPPLAKVRQACRIGDRFSGGSLG